MSVDLDPASTADIPQGRLKGGVAERLALASAQAQPSRRCCCGHPALLRPVTMKERPEIIRHRHSMFVSIAFETDGNGLPSLVDVGQPHSQHPVPSSDIVPVADALSCTEEQREDGLV